MSGQPVSLGVEEGIEALGIGAWRYHLASRTGSFSPTALALYGISGTEDVPAVEAIRACVEADELARFEQAVRAARASGKAFASQLRIRRASDGERRVLRVRGRFVTEADGEVIFGSVADITETASLLEELRRTRDQLESAERIGGTGSWSWDLRTGEVRWSAETYRIMGVAPTVSPSFELVLQSAVDDDHRQRFLAMVDDALAGRRAYEFEMPLRQPDGTRIIIETLGAVERGPDGTPVRLVGTVRDITALRQAERERLEREAVFRLLSESSPNGVFLTNAQGTTTYANQRLLEWFGMSLEEFAAERWRDRVHPDDRVTLEARLGEPRNLDLPFDFAYRIVVDGAVRWVHVRTAPVFGQDGQRTGHVGSAHDVTADQHAAAERAEYAGRLQQAQRLESIGLLAGGIAHDFNNLLVGILGNASYVSEVVGHGHELSGPLEDIVRSAQRAAELTRQLLIYAGRAQGERRPVAIGQLVTELPRLLGARVPPYVRLDVTAEAPGPTVVGDATALQQLVLNFVTNAVDAIHPVRGGTVTVQVSERQLRTDELAGMLLGADRPAGAYVVVTVRDTGVGMPPEVLSRMFDPFFSTKGTGRGLGLAAALGLVNSHDGAVAARSEPGVGTEIQLALLRALESAAAPAGDRPVSAATRGEGRILLVDDGDAARGAARRVLQRAGYTVEVARDGREALDVYEAAPTQWSCVVLDLTMPVMGGDECLSELRRRGATVPVLIASGYAAQDVADRVRGASGVSFLEKPYTSARLLEAVRTAVASR